MLFVGRQQLKRAPSRHAGLLLLMLVCHFQSKHIQAFSPITTSTAYCCAAYFCSPACITLLYACKLLVVYHKAVISHASSHTCMMPIKAYVQLRVMAAAAWFHAMLLARQALSLLKKTLLQPQASIPDPSTADMTLNCNVWQALCCCLLLLGRLATCCLVHNPAGCFGKGCLAHIRRASMAEAGVHTPSRQSVQASAGLQEPHAGQPKVPNGASH